MKPDPLIWCAATGVLTAAALDLRTRRIPNLLTLPMMLIGVAAHLVNPSPAGRLAGILGICAGLPFFLLWRMQVVGAGDAKLLMGVGALVGLETGLWATFLSILCGGALSLAALVYTKRLAGLGTFARGIWMAFVTGTRADSVGALRVPMGFAIAAGTWWSLIKS